MKAQMIVIQNDKDHVEAKAEASRLMRAKDPGDRARLIAQVRLIEAYERQRWPRQPVTLPELLAFLMDQHGLDRADLVPLPGTPSRVSKVLNGKRELSLNMIRRLVARFHIPGDREVEPGLWW